MARLYSHFLLFIFIRSVYTGTYSKSIPVQLGLNDSGPAIVSSTHLPSKFICAIKCLKLEWCIAVVYHSGSRMCSFLNSSETLVETSDLGHSYMFIGDHCIEGWVEFDGSCYLFGHHTYAWSDAMDYCNSEGATLVEIETAAENAFLQNKLSTITNPNHWIGMTDFDTEDVWMWASGAIASYIDWGTDQPNNGIVANCGAIWEIYGYKWVDEPCSTLAYPICERAFSSGP